MWRRLGFLLALCAPMGAQAQLAGLDVAPIAPANVGTPAAALPALPLPPRVMVARDMVVLQLLDKVAARTTVLRVPVGSSAAFGLLMITVRSCQSAPPSEAPESAAFLEIYEAATGGDTARRLDRRGLRFSGWMFASSPALSALENPTYDVTVLSCESRLPTATEHAVKEEEPRAPASVPATSDRLTADPAAPQD